VNILRNESTIMSALLTQLHTHTNGILKDFYTDRKPIRSKMHESYQKLAPLGKNIVPVATSCRRRPKRTPS